MEAWKHEAERLVNDLKGSAEYTEEKIENILKDGKLLLHNSKVVKESLASIDVQTQQLVDTSKNVESRVNAVFNQSEAILEQSKGIAASQLELREGHAEMKETLHLNTAMVHEAFTSLDQDIDGLRAKIEGVENVMVKRGDDVTSSMNILHNKADDIGKNVGKSLNKQILLDGQVAALDGLNLLTKTQSQAIEESRETLQQLAQLGYEQQEELLRRQQQLQQSHDHLVEKSESILAAQELFESKQASMFLAIDKLFTLFNATFHESRLIKAFLVYPMLTFLLYLLTSTKQTYNVRSRLYVGLCLTLLIEVAILRYGTNEVDNQAWNVISVRSLYVLLALCQLLYSVWTFRDYEILNHEMLQTLVGKVNGIQKHKEYLSWGTENDDSDSDMDFPSWIETELPEDVDKLKDPDYVFLKKLLRTQ